LRIRKGYLQEAIEKRREGEEEEEEENLAMVRRGSNLMFKSLYMPFPGYNWQCNATFKSFQQN